MIFFRIKKNFVVVFFSDAFAKELGIYNITFQFKKYFLLLQFETCHIKKIIDYNLTILNERQSMHKSNLTTLLETQRKHGNK